MLNSVRSLQTGRMGVIDDSTQKVIVPLAYKNIVFQKGGIVAEGFDGFSTAYNTTGRRLMNKGKNILFLNNNLILTSSTNCKCYILDCTSNKFICNIPFDSILVFVGSKEQAEVYNYSRNFSNIFNSSDYLTHGAHLEDLVCAQLNQKWGVINMKTGGIHAKFIHNVMVQCTGLRIAVRDDNGATLML